MKALATFLHIFCFFVFACLSYHEAVRGRIPDTILLALFASYFLYKGIYYSMVIEGDFTPEEIKAFNEMHQDAQEIRRQVAREISAELANRIHGLESPMIRQFRQWIADKYINK